MGDGEARSTADLRARSESPSEERDEADQGISTDRYTKSTNIVISPAAALVAIGEGGVFISDQLTMVAPESNVSERRGVEGKQM